MQGHQGIDEGLAILRVLRILRNEAADQGRAVHQHGLVGGRRADVVSLSPVGESLVIVFLLEILLVVGKVDDAVRAVSTVLSLGKHIRARQDHRKGQNG